MLAVFDNDCICRTPHEMLRDCVLTVELRCWLRHACIPAQLVKRRLDWFSRVARHPEDELIRDRLMLTLRRLLDSESSAAHDGEGTGWKSQASLVIQY